ncbi:hypothetical protein Plec18167_004204 [Paecilomyces lecythidis]|uniref:SET domain-containing protein n=1 Tax=Paecilomyces lecythidis TaxID=3004212 RepID=A0ABR3XT56_9EURO
MSSDELSVLETEYFRGTSVQESTVGTNEDQEWSDYDDGEIYENRITRTKKRRRKILAAIYFDINHVSILRRFFRARRGAGAAHHGIVRYKAECAHTANFIDHVVAQTAIAHGFEPFDLDCEIETQIHRSKDPRSVVLVTQLGWKLLAICAHSEAFRRACKEMGRTQWSMLLGEISQNRRSLEVFARSRSLEWRGPLLHLRTRSIYETLVRADIDLAAVGHPHHLVRMADGRVACPTYEDKLQENIEQSIFRSSDWPLSRRDPTMRVPADGECDLCFSKNICDCTVPSLAGDLVELVEYRGKGVGVRALANFKSDDILGLYLGELRPREYKGDPIYSLLQQPKMRFPGREAIISSKQYGNWTRFINHSCDPCTMFRRRTVGDRIYTTIEAVRDISIFEEITVDYGKGYFTANKMLCLCRTAACRYNNQTGSADQPPAGSHKDMDIYKPLDIYKACDL